MFPVLPKKSIISVNVSYVKTDVKHDMFVCRDAMKQIFFYLIHIMFLAHWHCLFGLCVCDFQRRRVMFATRCVREAAGGRGPASAFPVAPSSVAHSVWSSATSMKGTCISVCLCDVVPSQTKIGQS